ncbi:unnamed protein product [Bathycoccus prasinos]
MASATAKKKKTISKTTPKKKGTVVKKVSSKRTFVRVANQLKAELNGELEITRDASAGTFEVLVNEKIVWTITEKRPFPKLKAKNMSDVAALVRKAL